MMPLQKRRIDEAQRRNVVEYRARREHLKDDAIGVNWARVGPQEETCWLDCVCLSDDWRDRSSDPSDGPSTHNSGPYLTAHIISTRPRPPHHNAIHLHHRVHQHSLLICSCLSLRYGVTPTLPPASRAL